MPVVVAFFVRQLIIIGVQIGIFSMIDKFVTPLLNDAIAKIVSVFGVDEESAKDVLANEIITTAESLGLSVALSKARLPLVIAEKLGFTTKGFSKRKLSATTEQKIKGKSAANVKSPGISISEAKKVATEVAASRGLTFAKVDEVVTFILKIAGFPFVVLFTIAQFIDFGNWNSGAYQNTWQKILSIVTFGALVPDPQIPKSSVLSSDVWNKVYNTYREQGAFEIHDPYKKETVPFTRQNLIDLVDKIASALLLDTGEAGAKAVFAGTTALITFKKEGVIVTPSTTSAKPSFIPSTRVFTGIISQGALGTGLSFVPRPDDLITDTNDLQMAAQNNLAPFLAALPNKVIYELKVVASVTTKDGFTQRGEVRQIISGYKKDGSPKYRTVVNKFAVLYLYVLTDRGTKTKITTIILGPTDAIRFNPQQNDLTTIEKTLKSVATTNDITEATNITVAATPATTPSVAGVAATLSQKSTARAELMKGIPSSSATWYPQKDQYGNFINELGLLINIDGSIKTLEANEYHVGQQPNPDGSVTLKPYTGPGIGFEPFRTGGPEETISAEEIRQAANPFTNPNPPKFGGTTGPTGINREKPGHDAKTLFEWYQANGQQLPSVEARSRTYESLGLGQAAYYTGTGEQNTKLLDALKRK